MPHPLLNLAGPRPGESPAAFTKRWQAAQLAELSMHPYIGLHQARTELAARRGRGGARKNAYLRHPIEGAGIFSEMAGLIGHFGKKGVEAAVQNSDKLLDLASTAASAVSKFSGSDNGKGVLGAVGNLGKFFGFGELPTRPLGVAYHAPVGGAAHYRPDPRETAARGYLRNRATSARININGNVPMERVRVGAPIESIAHMQNEGLAEAPMSTFYEPLENFAAAGGRGRRGHARARHAYM